METKGWRVPTFTRNGQNGFQHAPLLRCQFGGDDRRLARVNCQLHPVFHCRQRSRHPAHVWPMADFLPARRTPAFSSNSGQACDPACRWRWPQPPAAGFPPPCCGGNVSRWLRACMSMVQRRRPLAQAQPADAHHPLRRRYLLGVGPRSRRRIRDRFRPEVRCAAREVITAPGVCHAPLSASGLACLRREHPFARSMMYQCGGRSPPRGGATCIIASNAGPE